MKSERLFQIVNLLMRKKSVTAPELAEMFQVSVRTIYRDIESLSLSSIPIYTSPGKNGGIFIIEEYKLEKTMLTDEEQNLLLQAVQGMSLLQSGNSGLLIKLSALFQKESKEWLEIDFSRWGNGEKIDKIKFDYIKSSIFSQQCLNISYCNMKAEVVKRNICPFKLISKSNSWYLYAYCKNRKGYRLFKVSRILSIEKENTFFSDMKFPQDNFMEQPKELDMLKVTLKFPFSEAYRVYDEFTPDVITKDKEGNLVVSTEMPKGEWIYGYILSFGTKIEVLEPENLKVKIRNIAMEIAGRM